MSKRPSKRTPAPLQYEWRIIRLKKSPAGRSRVGEHAQPFGTL
jgi:hypothetical protein